MEEGFLFKNVYNKDLIEMMAANINRVYSDFNKQSFINSIVPVLEPLSLSERSRLITSQLNNHLPKSYTKSLQILLNSFRDNMQITTANGMEGFYYMPIAGFVSEYGLEKEDYNRSINALIEITNDSLLKWPFDHLLQNSLRKALNIFINGQKMKMYMFEDWFQKEHVLVYLGLHH